MTDTPKPDRAPVIRAYITDRTLGIVEFRREGAVLETMKVTDVGDDILDCLAIEGAIRLRLAGASIKDILSGDAVKVSAPKERKPTQLMVAIAAVKEAELLRAARQNGAKPTKTEIEDIKARALTWARGLSAEQHATLGKNVHVKAELAKLTGVAKSLDEMLAPPVEKEAPSDTVDDTDLPVAAE
jgi:hypothetical protein